MYIFLIFKQTYLSKEKSRGTFVKKTNAYVGNIFKVYIGHAQSAGKRIRAYQTIPLGSCCNRQQLNITARVLLILLK